MKKSTINLTTILAFLAVLGVVFLAGCSSPKLSSDFNEADVKQAAENVVNLLNAQDSAGLKQLFTTEMTAAITDDVFTQIYADLAEGGSFEAIENISVIGSTDKSSAEDFAVAIVQAKYEKKTFIYTISFNKQMQLAGLYYK